MPAVEDSVTWHNQMQYKEEGHFVISSGKRSSAHCVTVRC